MQSPVLVYKLCLNYKSIGLIKSDFLLMKFHKNNTSGTMFPLPVHQDLSWRLGGHGHPDRPEDGVRWEGASIHQILL